MHKWYKLINDTKDDESSEEKKDRLKEYVNKRRVLAHSLDYEITEKVEQMHMAGNIYYGKYGKYGKYGFQYEIDFDKK